MLGRLKSCLPYRPHLMGVSPLYCSLSDAAIQPARSIRQTGMGAKVSENYAPVTVQSIHKHPSVQVQRKCDCGACACAACCIVLIDFVQHTGRLPPFEKKGSMAADVYLVNMGHLKSKKPPGSLLYSIAYNLLHTYY